MKLFNYNVVLNYEKCLSDFVNDDFTIEATYLGGTHRFQGVTGLNIFLSKFSHHVVVSAKIHNDKKSCCFEFETPVTDKLHPWVEWLCFAILLSVIFH